MVMDNMGSREGDNKHVNILDLSIADLLINVSLCFETCYPGGA